MFPLGKLVATPGALASLAANDQSPFDYLARHISADWGDLDERDEITNLEALKSGERLLSAYNLPDGERLYVITEGDRSYTTILLKSEY